MLMKVKHLTKREQMVMETLWNSEEALSANDIAEINKDVSIHTILQVLQKLLKMDYIKIAGIGYSKTSIARKYRPAISQAAQISEHISLQTKYQLASEYVMASNDTSSLDELEKLIKAKKEELKG